MILADYFRSRRDATWDIALQCGVSHGVVRLPEDVREKFRGTLTKIVNEGANGLICLIL